MRVQGCGAADPAALHGPHHAGRRRRGREDHDRDRHFGRHGQGRTGRVRRRRGHRHHRVLPAGPGEPRAGAADDHADRLQCACVRRQRQFRRCAVHGQGDLRRPGARRTPRRGRPCGALVGELDQRGPLGAAGRLLFLGVRAAARTAGDQCGRRGRLRGADRQFRRCARRLLREDAWPAGTPARRGLRQEQRAVRLPDDRHLQPQPPVLRDDLAVDGHPHLLEPRTHAVLHGGEGPPPDHLPDERPGAVRRL